MNEEEKEAIKYLKKHIIPYNNINGNLEFLVNDVLLNLIDKLQKENKELKEELDYFKQKENQDFDERDYYEE